jgi:hypothetical protein
MITETDIEDFIKYLDENKYQYESRRHITDMINAINDEKGILILESTIGGKSALIEHFIQWYRMKFNVVKKSYFIYKTKAN